MARRSPAETLPYHPKWWQVWLLPFAPLAVVGLVTVPLALAALWWLSHQKPTGHHDVSGEMARVATLDTAITTPITWGQDTVGLTTAVLTIRSTRDTVPPGERQRGAERLLALGRLAPSIPLNDLFYELPNRLAAQPDSFWIFTGRFSQLDSNRAKALRKGWAVTVRDAEGGHELTVVPDTATELRRRSYGELWVGLPLVRLPLR